MTQAIRRLLVGTLAAALCVITDAAAANDLEILQAYAEDFERDPFLKDAFTAGIKVGDTFYTLSAVPASENQDANVSVYEGTPETPTFYFAFDRSETLQELDAGQVHALTLAGKARSDDNAPLDIGAMEGFAPPEWFAEKITRLLFHLWTRGTPEIVPFASQETRVVHGANLGAFYYQPGFRSAWIDMQPGQHANEGDDSSNPFSTMVIMLKGEVRAVIGGEDLMFREGNMMLIPAGVTHEFINEGEENAFGILLMFGEGA